MAQSTQQQKVSKQEQVRRKLEAARVIKHPLIVEFFERGTQQLFDRFRTPVNFDGSKQTVEDREMINHQLEGLQAFQMFFQELIINGDMAEKEIAAKENKQSK